MKTYLKQRILNVIDIKKLVALEYLDFEGKYKGYVESHDFWELCYVEHGDVTLCTDYGEKKLTTGDVFFIPPDVMHSYCSPLGNDSRVFVICFECLSQAMKSLGGLHFSLKNTASNMQIIIDEYKHTFFMNENEHLEVLEKPNFGGQQVIILQMEYMFIQLLRRLSLDKNSGIVLFSEESFYAELTGEIIDYFNENLDRKLSLKEICTKVNYSRSFICKTFKEQTGETLLKYFNRLKMDKAKNLLSKTRMSVSNISDELGFNEPKHFIAMFKKFEGVSPLVYRQKTQGRVIK